MLSIDGPRVLGSGQADAQADLSLLMEHVQFCLFKNNAAQKFLDLIILLGKEHS